MRMMSASVKGEKKASCKGVLYTVEPHFYYELPDSTSKFAFMLLILRVSWWSKMTRVPVTSLSCGLIASGIYKAFRTFPCIGEKNF